MTYLEFSEKTVLINLLKYNISKKKTISKIIVEEKLQASVLLWTILNDVNLNKRIHYSKMGLSNVTYIRIYTSLIIEIGEKFHG